ncbi:beta-ketoacyl synthase domain-containing protein [Colletotrichum graminicola]|uniref:Beta-ketoacyl synthase domain-containing protein n=1 Tax=Colletotrichum graminicola (strain M1.001 / M2 / FGSC 10212) TaxID=645133 RepID=E3QS65_COLGM|nr:beta-ketoacyl synthase domain-containing protein [Colletotrichum graminicola M1.001]EFQ33703.1 beta-ketoacyl synthase domain-containing protein [Colletotrichum graminicola M1.001]WDK10719.1 beta-ketoacyl synthase domain-containing protein [Colletotrichum graminicola]
MTATPSTDGPSDLTSRLLFFSNEFPNDDLRDLFRRLHNHSKSQRFRLLATFLDACGDVVHHEAAALPSHLKKLIPPFKSVLSLADNHHFRQGPVGGALESALLCVLEIGMFIGHHEARNLPLDLPVAETTLSGLSIGLFAAAAISISDSLADVAVNGVESVRVAFRLGIHVDGVSGRLESRDHDGNYGSWAYVLTGLSAEEVQEELDRYNTESSNPTPTKVFISASDKTSVSVTGPPSRLKNAFRHSKALRYSKHFPMPVYNGLCHAPHLYTTEDVRSIVHGSEPKGTHSVHIRLPLLSPQTGKAYPAHNANELFREIVADILTGGIFLDNLSEGILDSISDLGPAECEVLSFRSSLVSKSILATVTEGLGQVTMRHVDFVDWSFDKVAPSPPRTAAQSTLAIVGMSCRLPGGANDCKLFWDLLKEGRDTHTEVPADRFDLQAHFDPTGQVPNSTPTPWGNFIDHPGLFDAAFFNMSPREAEQTDPMHRLALVTAYEALEMSGYVPNRTPSTILERVGTFYGQASDDWRELNAAQNIGTHAVPGGERAFANGRINYFFKFGGPSFNIDTACSSGLAAVNAACSALWAGEADTVIAGGLSVITNPDNYAMLGNGHFLSRTGQCKVWDEGADGYCRADGIGSVVIKRLEDAVADNDNIIATVLAGATNHSAYAASITQPHAGAQKSNYAQVTQAAGINPLDVSFVELHGTGTQVGDAIESESVCDFFAPLSPRRRADQPLHLGAVKSNVGHGEAAAGITSLLKVLLSFQNNEIPPHVGIKTAINPIIPLDLAKRQAGLVMGLQQWPREAGKTRYAVVNSFGAHGGNTTLMLGDAPERSLRGSDPRSSHPVVISAKGKISLEANLAALIEYLDRHPDTDLGDLSYTTTARRIHHSSRVAVSASSIVQLQKALVSAQSIVRDIRPVPANAPSVAFAFTGQGSFYLGVGAALYKSFPFYRQQITHLDHLVQVFGFPSVIPFIEGTPEDGSVSPLTTQLTIVVTQIALAEFWSLLGVKPNAVIGHSLGEYAALVVAGVISAADAILLVGKRAELVTSNCREGSHVMLAVRSSIDKIQMIATDGKYQVSCMNGTNDTVLGGSRDDIEVTRHALEGEGIKCTLLDVPFAFHTSQMDPMLGPFEQLAKHVTYKTPMIPCLSPVLGGCVFDGKTINEKYLARAAREPVNFVGALEAAQELGIIDEKTMWIEIGPHPVCTSLIRGYMADAYVTSSFRRDEDSFTTLSNTLVSLHRAGIAVNWNEYHRPYETCHSLLSLDAYKWNDKNYWIQYEGTWTLDKAYPTGKPNNKPSTQSGSALRTSSMQQIVSEEITGSTGNLVVVSDMMHPELLSALDGHHMNGYGVATSSIWADMALTVGEYLYKRMVPTATGTVPMNVSDMLVEHAQVVMSNREGAQLLQIEAEMDLEEMMTAVRWYNLDAAGIRSEEPYATATIRYEDTNNWTTEFSRISWLAASRVEALTAMVPGGAASRVGRGLAYTLFENVVSYSEKYRGMHSVVIHGLEAYADVILAPERHGTWHTPPHWIDSLFHVGGFVMNGSEASNTKDYFYVTNGWDSCRMAKPAIAGGSYQSYVRMAPTGEANMFSGDVYVLQDGDVVGMMGGMRFRRVHRILMDKFFSPSDGSSKTSSTPAKPKATAPKSQSKTKPLTSSAKTKQTVQETNPVAKQADSAAENRHDGDEDSFPAPSGDVVEVVGGIVGDGLKLIAKETGLDLSDLTDEATFVELGVDSLTSLVLAEKFKKELSIEVKSSLFLECVNVGDLKEWMEQNA